MSQLDIKNRSLGRGLESLLGEASADLPSREFESPEKIFSMPVERLYPGRFQPRQVFDPESLRELAESIKERGILQPILVRPLNDDETKFEIIAGERRWQAAKSAGFNHVPVLVRKMSDQKALEAALVENIQRQDLNPIEEGHGYKKLMEEFGYTQEQLSQAVRKSRSHIANTLRLLTLPSNVQRLLQENKITAGHARTLINSDDAEQLVNKIVAENLNVRQVEELTKKAKNGSTLTYEHNDDLLIIEAQLSALFLLPLQLSVKPSGGELRVKFKTLGQLDQLLERLSSKS